ncbi:MAG: hypothetical protein GX946_02510 [Oligosphaeraceae bacterium]|nr:hypothetical protein [Oligosphaeraceae bacterium]
MRKKLFVAVLMLTVSCSIALARGTACENNCAIIYSDQKETCDQMHGSGAENPNPELYALCLQAIENAYWRCMYNCAGE